MTPKGFDFGSLLVGKSKDLTDAQKNPEHFERLKISNTGLLDLEVEFLIQKDINNNNFFVSPTVMQIKKGESQELTLWCYPKTLGLLEDSLVCLIKDNPDPFFIPINATGAKPILEVEKTSLDFGRILQKNKDTQFLVIQNKSALELCWKLTGVEGMTDISFSQLSGSLEPFQSFKIPTIFEANQPISHKKTVKLEVTDPQNILGILQSIPITILAESYCASVDLFLPKGSTSQFDFGVIRVSEESKQTMALKNKGKYNMNFKFFTPNNPKLFTISPMEGLVSPNDKIQTITVTCKADSEIDLKDSTEIICHLIDPNSNQITSKVPIQVNVRSVFHKSSIQPEKGPNSGPSNGSKKSRQFPIQNEGETEGKVSWENNDQKLTLPPLPMEIPTTTDAEKREEKRSTKKVSQITVASQKGNGTLSISK